jgi:hypothetical protein
MRSRLTLIPTLALAAAALVPAAALAADPWVLAPKEFSAEVRGGWFSADDYHTTNGTRTTLPYGGLLEERSVTFDAELGWKQNMSFLISVPFASQTRRLGAIEGSSTTTGLADLVAGVKMRLAGKQNPISLQVDVRTPLGYDPYLRATQGQIAYLDTTISKDLAPGDSANNVRYTSPPRLGEGNQDVTGQLLYGLELPKFRSFFQVSGGYRYRNGAPSDQIVASGDLGVWLTKALLLSGHWSAGLHSGDGDNTKADEIQEQLLGERITLRLDHGLDMYAGAMHTAGAENRPHEDHFYVGIMFKQTSLNRYQGFRGGTAQP